MNHHYIDDSIVLLNMQKEGENLSCDVCWLDKYAPTEIEVPDLGKFKIPESAQGKKTSLTLLDLVLYPV